MQGQLSTLTKRIIPCLDIKDGRVVKGINFENLVDAGDPVSQAEFYYKEGADELCILDITASHEKRDIIYDIISKISESCFIPLTIGGGISSINHIRKLLLSGADKVSINSAAVKNPNLIKESSKTFGNQCIVVAIDAKRNEDRNFEIYINGGRIPTGIDALKWAVKMQDYGAGEILLTSMDKDGTKTGYDLELLELISSNLDIPIIASGGVGNLQHIEDGIKNGADAVLAASIFHFREYSINQVKEFLIKRNIPIRSF